VSTEITLILMDVLQFVELSLDGPAPQLTLLFVKEFAETARSSLERFATTEIPLILTSAKETAWGLLLAGLAIRGQLILLQYVLKFAETEF